MRKLGPVLAFLLTFATVGSAQLSKLTKGVGDLVSGVTGGAVTVDTQVGVTTPPEGGVGVTVDAGVGVNAAGVSAEVDANASASASPSGGVTAGAGVTAGTSATGGVPVGAGVGVGAGGVTAGVDVNATTPAGGVAAGADAETGAPAGVLGKDDGQDSSPTGSTNVAAKISSDLLNVDPASTVNVIVQFTGTPTSEELQRISAQGAVAARSLQIVKGVSFSVTAGKLAELAKESSVVYITRDRSVSAFLDYATETVGASIVQDYGYAGAGIGVAVIDSGVYAHPDLKDAACAQSRIVYEESFVADSYSGDPYGHGTHVAGIVGANGACVAAGSNDYQVQGVAPKANLISLRVLNAKGTGNDSGVIAAIQRAIELQDTYDIRVINLSLGRPIFESHTLDPLCQAVEAAWSAGIVVVSAAGNYGRLNSIGNEGYGTITSPGNAPSIITVGAMKTAETPVRADDKIATYSSKGPTLIDHFVKPDLVAPGNRILSLLAPNSEMDKNRLAAGHGVPASGDFCRLTSTN